VFSARAGTVDAARSPRVAGSGPLLRGPGRFRPDSAYRARNRPWRPDSAPNQPGRGPCPGAGWVGV